MATTDRTSATADAEAVATRLRGASFAHLLVRSDGESLAAAGLLADACVETGTPYQVSAVRTRADLDARRAAADEGVTAVALGLDDAVDDGHDAAGVVVTDRPSLAAFEAAEALGADPEPALALAGLVAGGGDPAADAHSLLERADAERRPGIAAPTADLADGLAHTTLAHAPYSGDVDAATDLVAGIDDDADRRVASLLAIDAVTADGATERAAEALERAIHPLAGGPLETVEGHADVLCALAATAPGRAVALALGGGRGPAADAALDAWREHAVAAHGAVRAAETERHAGLLVARVDGPVEATARLLRDFRSPEPAVLAIREPADDDPASGHAAAALATVDAPASPIEAAAEAAGGSGLASGTTGYARFDAEREADLVEAVRGAR